MASKLIGVVLVASAAAQVVENDCADAPGFVDEQGYQCRDWAGFDCKKAAETHGYSTGGEGDVLLKCQKTCLTCGKTTAAPTTTVFTQCSEFGGILTPDGSSCCNATCGDKCGTADCQDGVGGATNCCAGWIPDHVQCQEGIKAPCTIPSAVTCKKYNGIGHPTESDACCAMECGDKCGTTDCHHGVGGAEKCCFGAMTAICNDATEAPCYMPPGAGCYYRAPSCPKLNTHEKYKGSTWTTFWHADTWGHEHRNSWNDAKECTVLRKREIDEWCGITNTMMAFAAGPNEAKADLEMELKKEEERRNKRAEREKKAEEKKAQETAEQQKLENHKAEEKEEEEAATTPAPLEASEDGFEQTGEAAAGDKVLEKAEKPVVAAEEKKDENKDEAAATEEVATTAVPAAASEDLAAATEKPAAATEEVTATEKPPATETPLDASADKEDEKKDEAAEKKDEKKADAEEKDEKKGDAAEEKDEEKGEAAEKKDEKKDEAEDKKEELFQVQGGKVGEAPAVSSFAWLSVIGGVVALVTGVVFVVRKRSMRQTRSQTDSFMPMTAREAVEVDAEVEAPILG